MAPIPKQRGSVPAGASGAALYIYLPFDLDSGLREHAREHGTPLSRVVRQALREHLGRTPTPPDCGCLPYRLATAGDRQ
jgi:hypothetical protein